MVYEERFEKGCIEVEIWEWEERENYGNVIYSKCIVCFYIVRINGFKF